jgi:RND family efflux transporter MFP subunit
MKCPRKMIGIACSGITAALLSTTAYVTAQETVRDCVITAKSTVKLGSPEEGILTETLVDRGDHVNKGDIVAKLDTEVEQLSAELARLQAKNTVEIRSSRAQAEFRRKEVDRLETLHSQKTVPEKSYDQAVIESQLADLALEAANTEHRLNEVEYRRARAHLDRRSIRSPVDGVIVDVMLSPGEYVHEQAPLMSIAEIDPLNVEVFIPVAQYGAIATGMEAEVRPEEPIGGRYRARVTVVDNVFDPASRTFGVRLELPNPDHALPAGLRCTVQFQQEGGGPRIDGDLGFTDAE